MVNPDSYPREGTIKITHGAGSITWRENDSNKIKDWEFDCVDNRPWFLSFILDNSDIDGAINILSSSCAIWSAGTGSLAFGDKIEFGMYAQDHSTLTWYFEGVVCDIQPAGDDAIKVSVYDPSRILDMIQKSRVYYKNVRSSYWAAGTYNNGYLSIDGIADADIATPFIKLRLRGSDDPFIQFGKAPAVAGYNIAGAAGRLVCQPFIARGDYNTGFTFTYKTVNYGDGAGNPYNFTLKICADDPNNVNFPGKIIKTYSITAALKTGNGSYTSNLGNTYPIVPGAKYWFVLSADVIAGSLIIDSETPGTDSAECTKEYTGAAWVGTSYQLAFKWVYFAAFEEIDPNRYYFDDANNKIWVFGVDDVVGTPVALLDYYYGTRTLKEISDWLCKLSGTLLSDIHANCQNTYKTFYTKGQKLGDCLRVLMDTFEDGGAWSGRQHIMAYYRDGSSIPRLKIGKRLDITNDTEYLTIAYPPDRPSNSDEWLVAGDGVQLTKTYKMKYSEVTVIGQDPQGQPIICRRSDRAKTGSMFAATGGICERLTVTDDGLVTLGAVNSEAYRILDSVSRDVWEGKITLTGHHIGIVDFDNTSDTFGCGKIIKLYWSPLGMGSTKMKVTRAIFRMNGTTEIMVNNSDPYWLNKLSRGLGTLEKVENMMAPIGDPETIYIETFLNSAITDNAQMKIALYDEAGQPLTDLEPVNATRYTNSRYNLRTYHAEFERQNGYNVNGQVRYVELTKAGVQQAIVDLNRTTGSIKFDEMGNKFVTTRMIVELNCKDS